MTAPTAQDPQPPPRSSADPARSRRTIVLVLILSGITMIAIAIALGILVSPVFYAVALAALVDFGLARAFASGRIGARGETDLAAAVEADPTYNPYARED